MRQRPSSGNKKPESMRLSSCLTRGRGHHCVDQPHPSWLVRLFPARSPIYLLVGRRLCSPASASDPTPTASSSGAGSLPRDHTRWPMPSSLILGCSRCPRPFDWRADPDVETTDWRALRGRTAHRVRREGTATAVSYPYPSGHERPFGQQLDRTPGGPLHLGIEPSLSLLETCDK